MQSKPMECDIATSSVPTDEICTCGYTGTKNINIINGQICFFVNIKNRE
jgi:hypothetical protein